MHFFKYGKSTINNNSTAISHQLKWILNIKFYLSSKNTTPLKYILEFLSNHPKLVVTI